MKSEIKVNYQENFDRLLVIFKDFNISTVHKFNGCQIFLDEAGIVIGYMVRGHSERPCINRSLMHLLGVEASELDAIPSIS